MHTSLLNLWEVNMIKPKRLKKGDTIGVISPASPSDRSEVDKLERVLTDKGFKVKMGKSPYETNRYLAGEDDLRAEDVNSMFADSEVQGILCVRGGYGTPRILDKLDYDLIRDNPKIFLGYSDITSLHIAFNQICGLVTYHGPMGVSDIMDGLDPFTEKSLIDIIMSGEENLVLANPEDIQLEIIQSGQVEGEIIGGNLSLIADTMGTDYEIDCKDKILFIEEIGEKPRNIDRMLNQLRLAGKIQDAKGVILGDFNNCDNEDGETSFVLREVVEQYFGHLDKPVIYNFKSGHCEPMITIPFGVKVRLDGDNGKVILLEGATE